MQRGQQGQGPLPPFVWPLTRPAFAVPVGTIEWHGHHNPLGLDALKAHALCVRAAEQCGGVAMPPLWYGEHREI